VDNSKKTWSQQAGVTPGKLALIGGLAIALAAVLYLQYAPSERPAAVATPMPRTATQAAANQVNSAVQGAAAPAVPLKKTGTVTKWHAPNLDRVVAYDPFALPAAFPKPQSTDEATVAQTAAATQDASQRQAELEAARAKSEGELQGLKQQAVKVMITRNDEFVAIVGDQEVRVGDELNGFKVIAIDSDGVHVAKDLTQ
jgi:hypothetical protein